jgi:O-acetyl-ADP-ribose deacetylase (regulator of RNase III)
MNQLTRQHKLESGQHLQIVQGDLTKEKVQAIVNAANAQLQHGGGVAGAIARAGGPHIQVESDAWIRQHGPVSNESPAYTRGGELPCRYVIHAVGPVWGEGDEDIKLNAAVLGALGLGDQLGITSIAFPAISTGIYGFPKERAANIILSAFHDYFKNKSKSSLNIIRLTLFDREALDVFCQVWDSLFPAKNNRS